MRRTLLVLALVLAGSRDAGAQQAPPPPDVSLTSSSHNWILPTGDLLPAGRSQLIAHDFVYGELAYGLTDRIEIGVGLFVVPVVGSFNARVSLLAPESPLRLVVGGSAWWESGFLDDDACWSAFVGTVTLAYQTESFNLHVTGAFAPPREAGPDGDGRDAFGISNAGLTLRVGARTALMFEMAELVEGDRESSNRIRFALAGIKLLRERNVVDLGVMYVLDTLMQVDDAPDEDGQWMPMLSATQRF